MRPAGILGIIQLSNSRASCLNVARSVSIIKDKLQVKDGEDGLKVQGAIYHIDSGEVEFLD